MEKNESRVNIKGIDTPLKERMKARCDADGITISEYIINLIEQDQHDLDMEELYQK